MSGAKNDSTSCNSPELQRMGKSQIIQMQTDTSSEHRGRVFEPSIRKMSTELKKLNDSLGFMMAQKPPQGYYGSGGRSYHFRNSGVGDPPHSQLPAEDYGLDMEFETPRDWLKTPTKSEKRETKRPAAPARQSIMAGSKRSKHGKGKVVLFKEEEDTGYEASQSSSCEIERTGMGAE